MTQTLTPDIDPDTTDGTGLANILNDDKNSYLTSHSGGAAPSYRQQGTMWLDTSSTPYVLRMFDGSSDVPMGNLDVAAHSFGFSVNAIDVAFDSSSVGIDSDEVQGAIVEVANGKLNKNTDDTMAGSLTLTRQQLYPESPLVCVKPENPGGFPRFEIRNNNEVLICDFTANNNAHDLTIRGYDTNGDHITSFVFQDNYPGRARLGDDNWNYVAPTLESHIATKKYVDDSVAGGGSGNFFDKTGDGGYYENAEIRNISTGSASLSFAENVHDFTFNVNCTLTFPTGLTFGKSYSMTLITRQDGVGGRTISLPGSITWIGEPPSAPTAAGTVAVYSFMTTNEGISWLGFYAGDSS